MAVALAILAVGVACAVVGGTIFVRGVVGLAIWWRVAPGVVGATVAAFATSGPELSVGINSALAGEPQIALGDALGSNVVNIGVVLGIALLFRALHVHRSALVLDLPLALLAPVALALLALDGRLSRIDAAVMIIIFLAWLVQTTLTARRNRDAASEVLGERNHRTVLLTLFGGLVLLIIAGRLVTVAAIGISEAIGWGGFAVGILFVSLGTSTPEIATMLASRHQGHDEVGVGTVLGSNIFNTLLIVGSAAMISPISVARSELVVAALASTVVVLFALPGRSMRLARWRSLPLLATYIVMLLVIGLNA